MKNFGGKVAESAPEDPRVLNRTVTVDLMCTDVHLLGR